MFKKAQHLAQHKLDLLLLQVNHPLHLPPFAANALHPLNTHAPPLGSLAALTVGEGDSVSQDA